MTLATDDSLLGSAIGRDEGAGGYPPLEALGTTWTTILTPDTMRTAGHAVLAGASGAVTTFADPGERRKALGIWGAVGLLLIGMLTQTLRWLQRVRQRRLHDNRGRRSPHV
jgi:hypothetical protein